MSSSLVSTNSSDLVNYNSKPKLGEKKRIILDEDEFIAGIDQIIERDFFPDLYQLRQECVNNDSDKLTSQDTNRFNFVFSPASFETPSFESNKQQDPNLFTSQNVNVLSSKSESNRFDNLSLNEFLNKYTSEDDASFDEIIKEAEKRHRIKYSWLYQDEDSEANRFKQSLALTHPSSDSKAIESMKTAGPITWSYRNKNFVMFVPEQDRVSFNKCPSVAHENTRFKINPFTERLNEEKIAKAAILNAKEREGKIGVDGKEISNTPKVGNYSFVSMTPSPAPGANSTPFMTWGYIENTPYNLDEGETPLPVHSAPGTPQFKIPDIPEREKVAHSLADKMSKQNRDKKKQALKNAQYLKSGSLIIDRLNSPFERVSSPATQKLKKLRSASSPYLNTPHKLIFTTPSSTRDSSGSSITDNLLKLPN